MDPTLPAPGDLVMIRNEDAAMSNRRASMGLCIAQVTIVEHFTKDRYLIVDDQGMRAVPWWAVRRVSGESDASNQG